MEKFFRRSVSRRVLGVAVAIAMFFSVFANFAGSLLTAKAAGDATNITVHFNNNAWKWGAPALQYWQFDDVTASNYQDGPTEITGWGGAKGYTLKEETDGWYAITLTGKIEGFQFLDMSNPGNNTGGKGYDALMSGFQDETAKDLYYKESDGTWYLDKDYTTKLAAPENDKEETEDGTISVGDSVSVKVGDATADMQLYNHGIYEAALDLTAGTYDAEVLVNGVASGQKSSVTVDADQKVYFRLQDGTLKDSVNDGIVHTAALTGNFMGLEFVDEAGERFDIASWTPSDANAELTYYGGGLYGRTFQFNELAEDVAIADGGYKVAFDDGWDYSIGDGSSNIALTVPAGSTSLTVFVDEINGVVYDDVRTPDFEVAQNTGALTKNAFTTSVSLIGPARGDVDTWVADVQGYEFTQISDTLYRYQKTYEAGTYDYKCVFDYANWYEAEAGNRSFTVSEKQNVVFLYNTADGKLYDSVNNADVVAQLLGMKAAPAEMKVVDNANGTTNFIALANEGQKVTLYYGAKADVEANGADALKKVSMSEVADGASHSGDIFLGDEAQDIVYYYDIDGTKVLDGSNETVTVSGTDYSNYTRDAFTGRTVNVPGTLPGPSWDAASNVMIYKGNGRYEYTFTAVPAAKYEYKIAMGSWNENYGLDGIKDGANISVTVPEKMDVTIYYSDFSHRAVNSIDYKFVDISLSGTGIPEGTKLTDDGLTGIYTANVYLEAGTYADVVIGYDGKEYKFDSFDIEEGKTVTFAMDPVTELYYHNASNKPFEEDKIKFDSKDEAYKSVYGAVATGKEVTFTLETGEDITSAKLLVKGVKNSVVEMEKDGDAKNGVQKWSVTKSFDTIGEYKYYFAVSNGAGIKVYGDDDGFYGTGKVSELTEVLPYDLVVYKDGFETPDWMKDAVIYQIFPDRFYDGDESNNDNQTTARGAVSYEYIPNWYMLPENPEQEGLLDEETYKATGAYYGDGQWSNEIYGGDLEGITDRIDYLEALGVNVIYLNPVFSSISSHRYDACDYTKIDPVLGTLGDFSELVNVAEEHGMKVVLDGVFNHVSDDSIYFDRYYKFLDDGLDTIGAYPYWAYVYDYMAEKECTQEEAEEAAKTYFTDEYGITDYSYTTWFEVYQDTLKDDDGNDVFDTIGNRTDKPVYGYEGWWGYDSMPVIKSTNGSEFQTGNWADKIIYNEDETSVTQYWISQGMDGWRLDVANEVSDETWQNFRKSVKSMNSDAVIIGEIWDDATKYILGDMYDSVMNYMFRNAVTSFAKGDDAQTITNNMERLRERYPEEAFYAMMNLVGSHDTTRILSYLDGIDDDRKQTDIASAFPTYETTSDLAKQRQYLVAFLQFTYAGAPTIYYGDEIGMVGSDDPDDRRAFEWGKGNKELVTWYAKLAAIREQYAALRTGSVDVIDTKSENVMGYVRSDKDDSLIVLANNSDAAQKVSLSLADLGMDQTTLTDIVNNAACTVADGVVTVTVPALSGVVLTDNVKEINVDVEALAPAYDEKYIVAERSVTPPADEEETTEKPAEEETTTVKAEEQTTTVKAEEEQTTTVKADEEQTTTVKADEEQTTTVKADEEETTTVAAEEETTTVSDPGTASGADTGDHSAMPIMVVLFGISMLGVVLITVRKKERS